MGLKMELQNPQNLVPQALKLERILEGPLRIRRALASKSAGLFGREFFVELAGDFVDISGDAES